MGRHGTLPASRPERRSPDQHPPVLALVCRGAAAARRVEKRLAFAGLVCEEAPLQRSGSGGTAAAAGGGCVLLLVSAPVELLAQEAERKGLLVPSVRTDDDQSCLRFSDDDAGVAWTVEALLGVPQGPWHEQRLLAPFEVAYASEALALARIPDSPLSNLFSSLSLCFTPAEQAQLTFSLIQGAGGAAMARLAQVRRAAGRAVEADGALRQELVEWRDMPGHSRDLVEEMMNSRNADVHDLLCLHDEAGPTTWEAWPLSEDFVEEVRQYYGSEVAMYFAFMRVYCLWLVPPACFGILLLLAPPQLRDVEAGSAAPAYALLLVTWAIPFPVLVRRSCAGWAARWGTLGAEASEAIRPRFRGVVRVSQVTGRPELFFSPARRAGRTLCSCAVSALFLGLAFAVGIAFLNLQGNVHAPTQETGKQGFAWYSSMFYFPNLAALAAPGALLDASTAAAYVPYALQIVVAKILNTVYCRLAALLTAWENHHTVRNHTESLVLKRCCFDSLNYMLPLLYLAFWEMDIPALQRALQSLLACDCARRLASELLLPMLVAGGRSLVSARHQQGAAAVGAEDLQQPLLPPSASEMLSPGCAVGRARHEVLLDRYCPYDDYLEMAIEFAYVSMFAAVCPISAALSLVCNLVEMRSDRAKLNRVCRRPVPGAVSGIGIWNHVLDFFVLVSVLSNCALFGFCTHQIGAVFPSLSKEWKSSGERRGFVVRKAGVFAVFGVEHLLLLLLALARLVPDAPDWVRTALDRRRFLEAEAARVTPHARPGRDRIKEH